MSFFDRERTIAKPGYSRWMVPPAALCVHLCIGQAYAFSVFNLPMTKLIGITQSAPNDWNLPELGWIFSIAIFFLAVSSAGVGRSGHRAASSAFLAPATEHRRRYAQKENGDRENPAQLRQIPVVRRRLRNADELCHRQIEHAERIGLADTKMHAECSRRHHPAVKAGSSNRVAAIQKTHSCLLPGSSDCFLSADCGLARLVAPPRVFQVGSPQSLANSECERAIFESINNSLSLHR